MPTLKEETVLNGVDLDQLKETIGRIKQNPSMARFQFRASNRWLGGSHNRSELWNFHGANEEHAHLTPFHLENDEPKVLFGDDQFPNPVEYILHALAGCLTTTLTCHAAARGIEIEKIQSLLEGDLDVRGFMGLSDEVRNGYQEIRVTLRVKSDASAAKLTELAKLSPVLDTLSNPVKVIVQIEKEP